VLIGTPRRNGGNVKAGEDLGGKGVVELAWDLCVARAFLKLTSGFT